MDRESRISQYKVAAMIRVLILAASISLMACTKAPEPQPSAAQSTPASISNENVHEFKLGELSAFALKDGAFVIPNDSKIIAINRKPEEVATLLQAAGAPTSELHLSIQPLLVRSGEKVLLFDTGAGTSERWRCGWKAHELDERSRLGSKHRH